jgi:hypothetical protein
MDLSNRWIDNKNQISNIFGVSKDLILQSYLTNVYSRLNISGRNEIHDNIYRSIEFPFDSFIRDPIRSIGE